MNPNDLVQAPAAQSASSAKCERLDPFELGLLAERLLAASVREEAARIRAWLTLGFYGLS